MQETNKVKRAFHFFEARTLFLSPQGRKNSHARTIWLSPCKSQRVAFVKLAAEFSREV
jgi:hypothetical protein